MTRTSLRSTLSRMYWLLALVLAFSLFAKLSDHVPMLQGTGFGTVLRDVYEYLKDMSLLIATGGVAYITNIFQQRSTFVANLEQEWRGIVATKSALYSYCEKSFPTSDDYVSAFCRISETLDNMRIVYCNVGETKESIGLYPYAPLHDMRRALQTLDPRANSQITPEQRRLARDAILQSFYALRENFLEELDLATPDRPLLISGGRRLKSPGAAPWARSLQEQQAKSQKAVPVPRPDIDEFLARLYEVERRKGQG